MSGSQLVVAYTHEKGRNGNIQSKGLLTSHNQTSSANNNTGEEPPSRDKFKNSWEFLMSCISMCVGLGNIWRFPGVAAANGGGAFLVPYLIVLLLVGRPVYYLEMCIGQFSSTGQVKVWEMSPILKGVGYGSLVAVICTCTYYVSIMAITLYYFIASFSSPLPWAPCALSNATNCNQTAGTAASEYFDQIVFPQLPNIDNGLGNLNLPLAGCLVLSWCFLFITLVKGVKSSGKVAYFTAIFPYAVLFVLLIRGVTLPGAWKGIKIFLTPDWGKLIKTEVWYAALEQCFFSMTIGYGCVTMFSSYNKFRHTVYKDAIILSCMDTFTSFLAGITAFSVIGNLMEVNGLEFSDIQGKTQGFSLAFKLYPQAIASFGGVLSQLFAVLFFLMFFTLGLGSAASLVGAAVTVICDQYPYCKKWVVTLVVSAIGCVSGLMYCTEGGGLMIELIDRYGGGFVIYIMVILECVGICWVYGIQNICNDIEFMLGRKTGAYWRVCWAVLIPAGLTFNLVYFLSTTKALGGVPLVATVFGWLITSVAVGMLPAWAIYAVVTQGYDSESLSEKVQLAIEPSTNWGPKDEDLHIEWEIFRASKPVEVGVLARLGLKFSRNSQNLSSS